MVPYGMTEKLRCSSGSIMSSYIYLEADASLEKENPKRFFIKFNKETSAEA
jgi:hypothetical protein